MKIIIKITLFTFLVLIFQNCDEIVVKEEDKSVHIVTGSTEGFNKIELKYSSVVSLYSEKNKLFHEVALSIDLNQKMIRHNELQIECILDQQRFLYLKELYSNQNICSPAPPPPNTAVCLAMGINDISLKSNQTNEYDDLFPVVCNNGRYLCKKHDEFKKLLIDIYENPPEECTGI